MRSKDIYTIVYIISTILFFGCASRERDTILFPSEIAETSISTNVIHSNKNAMLRILIHSDSTGCTGCKLQLDVWKLYMEDIKRITNNNVDFIFYLQPKDKEELLFILENEEFNHPIYIDEENELAKLNNINGDHVFLLDKENRILLSGNPLKKTSTKKKYKDIIQKYVNGG